MSLCSICIYYTITYAVTTLCLFIWGCQFSANYYNISGSAYITLTLIHILLTKRSSIFIIGSFSYYGMSSWKSHLYSLLLSSSMADSIWGWPKRNRLSQSYWGYSESFWLLVSSWESKQLMLWSFWSTTSGKSVDTPLKNLCLMLASTPSL